MERRRGYERMQRGRPKEKELGVHTGHSWRDGKEDSSTRLPATGINQLIDPPDRPANSGDPTSAQTTGNQRPNDCPSQGEASTTTSLQVLWGYRHNKTSDRDSPVLPEENPDGAH